jgi:hypothetical protein
MLNERRARSSGNETAAGDEDWHDPKPQEIAPC